VWDNMEHLLIAQCRCICGRRGSTGAVDDLPRQLDKTAHFLDPLSPAQQASNAPEVWEISLILRRCRMGANHRVVRCRLPKIRPASKSFSETPMNGFQATR
jgi:hypothetical protein